MKLFSGKKTWIDYIIYLFWAFLLFTTIYDLFHIPVRSIYWFVFFLLAILIYSKKWLPKSVYLVLAVLTVFQVFGELYLGFLYIFPNYDKVDHVIGGIEFCILLYYTLNKKVPDKRLLIFFSFLFSLFLEYLWEIIEYFSDTYLGTMMAGVILRLPGTYLASSAAQIIMPAYQDTIYDMFYCLVGGIIFVVVALFLLKRTEKRKK